MTEETPENPLLQSIPDIIDQIVDKTISEVGLDSDEYAALAGNEIMRGIHKLQDDDETVEDESVIVEQTEVAVEEAVGHLDLPPQQKAALKAEIISLHREAQRNKKLQESAQMEMEQQQQQFHQKQQSEAIVTELEAKLSQIKAREEVEEQAKHVKMTRDDQTLLKPSSLVQERDNQEQSADVKNEAEKVLENEQQKRAELKSEEEEEKDSSHEANYSDEL